MIFSQDRILIKCAINPTTGYGRDGISLAQELLKLGADVHLEPLWAGVPLPEEVAFLFTKPRPDHFEYALVHTDPSQLNAPAGLAKCSNKVIGWSMWEFTSMASEQWATNLQEQFKYFDTILAYDSVSKQAFEEFIEPDRLRILQGGYDSSIWLPKESDSVRDWDGVFRFAMVGALNQRKNPFATINAFIKLKELYGDKFNAELHMKNLVPTLHPMMEKVYPWLKIHYENWSQVKLKEFYSQINCLVAPSWGEGKNLPALEAQTMAVPVIASKFGGHLQWADPAWTYLVDGELEEHSPGQKSMRVNEDELANTMWHIYNNRVEAKNKGLLASKTIPQQCDWQNVVERLSFLLESIVPKARNF